MDRHIPHDHIGLRIPLARQVLGQPLVQPERKYELNPVGDDALGRTAVDQIVDHGVDELMVYHMAELFVGPLEGDGYPVLEQFGDAADPLRHVGGGNIGLLEIVMRIVDDDGDTFVEFPVQVAGHLSIRLLDDFRGKLRQRLAVCVEVDIEMRRLKELPVKIPVLDFVLTERLGVNRA